MTELKTFCGADCGQCGLKDECAGCAPTNGRPFGGACINLQYTLPGGQQARFWDDNRLYLGNRVCKRDNGRCFGLTADEIHLLVCEYGEGGSDTGIVLFKRRG